MRLHKLILFLLCLLWMMGAQANSVSAADFKGKWVIINYWAAWCHSCLKEMPELNRFYQHNKNKNIVLYGYNYDQLSGEKLTAAIKATRIAFPLLSESPQSIWSLGEITVLPVTYIINPDGQVVKKIMGVNTEKSLLNTLRTLQG